MARPLQTTGENSTLRPRSTCWLLEQVAVCVLVPTLAACGGGGGSGGGGAVSCSPRPSITSTPPTTATVGQQYRYHARAQYACIPFLTHCGGIDGVQLPADAGIDNTRAAVFWTPSPSHANTIVGLAIATKPDPCGDRATQSWSVTVASDTTAPTIASVWPTGPSAFLNSGIQVSFNEEVDPATVTPTSLVVTFTSTGASLAGNISYSSQTAVFTPSAPFPPSTSFTVNVTTDIKDPSGNALAAPYTWSFTSSSPSLPPDTTPPSVISTAPAGASSCAATDSLVSVNFDEPVIGINASTLVVRDSNLNAVPGTTYGAGTSTASFVPDSKLQPGSSNTVTFLAGTVKDAAENSMLGGNQTWSFTTSAQGVGSWSPISTLGAPPPRFDVTVLWTGSEMIVWGGSAPRTGARYSPTNDSWLPIASNSASSERIENAAVWTGTEMIMWGGRRDNQSFEYRNDGVRYNPTTDTWTGIGNSGLTDRGATSSTAVWTGSEMLVFGGVRLVSPNNGINTHNVRYNRTTGLFTRISQAGAPNVQLHHTAVWTGSKMIVWGGSPGFDCGFPGSSCEKTGSGAAYDPATDTWSPISSVGAPSARIRHSAIWDGFENDHLGRSNRSPRCNWRCQHWRGIRPAN